MCDDNQIHHIPQVRAQRSKKQTKGTRTGLWGSKTQRETGRPGPGTVKICKAVWEPEPGGARAVGLTGGKNTHTETPETTSVLGSRIHVKRGSFTLLACVDTQGLRYSFDTPLPLYRMNCFLLPERSVPASSHETTQEPRSRNTLRVREQLQAID